MTTKPVTNPLALVKAGREAAKAIPGMPGKIIKGMFLNFGLLIAMLSISNGLVYFFLLGPMYEWADGLLPEKLDWFATSLTTILVVAMLIGSIYLAVRWSFNLMHLWYEELAEKVLLHQHPQLVDKKMPGNIGGVILDVLKEIPIMLGLLLLNFVPAIGTILSLVWTAHRVGLSNYQPYNAVLIAHQLGDKQVTLKFLRPPTLFPGAALLLIAMVPFVGWLILWWVAMHMVIGASWSQVKQLPTDLAEPAS